jgi:molecular chaperone GrpE
MTDTEPHTTQASGAEAPEDRASQAPATGGVSGAPEDGEAQAPPAVQGAARPAAEADARRQTEQPIDGEVASSSSQQSMSPKRVDPGGAIEEELDTPFGAHGELVKTAAERDQYLALAQRTQADFENYRKRVARDAVQAQERGVVKLAKELLPALDNLDRAIDAAEDEDPLLAGVRLVRSELGAALARLGIEAFAPLGEAFDPNLHEAVAQQPVEGVTSGAVAEVFQNGYRMGETIIRPARVLVAA